MVALGVLFSGLLALQFGLQPLMSSTFQDPAVSKVGIVMATEFLKIVISLVCIFGDDPSVWRGITSTWTLRESVKKAALPAILFAMQNLLIQEAFTRVDALSFNIVNQTKTLSNAFFLYVVLGQKCSPMQILALILLFLAAVLLSLGDHFDVMEYIAGRMAGTQPEGVADAMAAASASATQGSNAVGLLMTLTASVLSGLSGTLTQAAITTVTPAAASSPSAKPAVPRNSFLFSMELAAYGILFLLLVELRPWVMRGVCYSPLAAWVMGDAGAGAGQIGVCGADVMGDGLREASFLSNPLRLLHGWSALTAIPVTSNALGGIVVGLVVKHAGGVGKGYALISGIIITAGVRWVVEGKALSPNTWIAVVIVCVSIYLHTNYPLKKSPAPPLAGPRSLSTDGVSKKTE